jgi:hypothetical protein
LVTTTATAFVDHDVTIGTTYEYVVTSIDDTRESEPSAAVSAMPLGPPQTEVAPEGLILHLDASDLLGLVSDGAQVHSWPDASGATGAALAGATSTAPTLVTDAIGGSPALRFDGVDDHFVLAPGFTDFTAGLTIYVVARPSVMQPGFKLVVLGNGAGQENIGLGRAGWSNGLQYWVDRGDGGVGWFNVADALVAGGASVFAVEQGGGAAGAAVTATVTRDGAVVGAGSVWVPPVAERSQGYLGKSYWSWVDGHFEGDIAEVIVYDRTLSLDEKQSLEAYLAAKYSL